MTVHDGNDCCGIYAQGIWEGMRHINEIVYMYTCMLASVVFAHAGSTYTYMYAKGVRLSVHGACRPHRMAVGLS